MKKIATLLLAAGLVFGAATGASAIDFKAKGQWIMSFDLGKNQAFTGGNGITGNGRTGNAHEDEFDAKQRVRLQLDAVASEALSGTVYFEIGDQRWGDDTGVAAGRGAGGALGADGVAVEVKRAYIDWIVPETDLKVRMGIQGLALPSFTTGSQVFNDDVAGVALNYQFNENVGLTAFWARLYNDNFGGNTSGRQAANYLDNLDAFALLLPLTFDGVKVTPWAMYAAIGPNTFKNAGTAWNSNWANGVGASRTPLRAGLIPVNGSMHKDGASASKRLFSYGNAFWAGLTGEVTAFDPFRIAWDVNYGDVRYGDSRASRHGWLASLLFEYKLDWAIPGLYGWYASGDDNNPANGSERMPTFGANNNNNGFSHFAFNGNPYIAREGVLGSTMVGTWGVGARLKDMSFLEDLKHTFRINLIGGTNSKGMAKYISAGGTRNGAWNTLTGANSAGVGMDPLYMTTGDTALEFGLTNTYQMYENFTVMLDANYIATWLDKSRNVWGRSSLNQVVGGRPGSDQVRDPWNVNLSFVYSF